MAASALDLQGGSKDERQAASLGQAWQTGTGRQALALAPTQQEEGAQQALGSWLCPVSGALLPHLRSTL